MFIMIWNVRGFYKKGRKKNVTDHIHKYNPSIIALVETKLSLLKFRELSVEFLNAGLIVIISIYLKLTEFRLHGIQTPGSV